VAKNNASTGGKTSNMNNPNNSAVILTVNLMENATGIQPPPEWMSHLSKAQNAERIDRQLNSPYYKSTDFVRLNRKYKPILKTCSRIARVFFDDLTEMMNQDNMLAISYSDISEVFDISRPSITPCIVELAEKGLIIYTPGTSCSNPSTFYINPKLAGCCKLSHQRAMEADFDNTLRKQPAIQFKKTAIPDGEKCYQTFCNMVQRLGIDQDKQTDFATIPIADKKNGFYANEIRAKETAAPNPRKQKKGSAANTAKANKISEPSITHNESKKQDFANDSEIPFN
jgi:hypothetical protein